MIFKVSGEKEREGINTVSCVVSERILVGFLERDCAKMMISYCGLTKLKTKPVHCCPFTLVCVCFLSC